MTTAATSGSTDETLVGDDVPRPAPEHDVSRGHRIGRYLLLDPVGEGAMGRVFRAYDPDLDRRVAIKVLLEDTRKTSRHRDRLLSEAKAMARIDHPNVIKVHDAGVHEGSVFIAMEIVDGPSLDRWLQSPRSPAELLDVLTGAGRGLAAAHAAGVIHRDFKPANVLVTADGRAKVGDFGLAGIEDASTNPSSEQPASGRAIGTPAYMSPEHLVGVAIDARSDQFSFGITLHEALHGTRPFSGTTWPELAIQISTGAVIPALAARRRGIDGIIRRALEVDPGQRFASMDELIAALERARRPAWPRWAALAGGVATIVGVAVLQPKAETETCEAGSERVAAFWDGAARDALRVGGEDYTEAFASEARARLEAAIDDYAARWSTAHEESCRVVGPHARQGSAAEQHAAQCLENRRDSLQGLVELATERALDPSRVDELIDTLPELGDCSSGQWVPYPADPARAAGAAALHRRLDRIQRSRLADLADELVEQEARTTVHEARELGDPYVLALALRERARLLEERQDVRPLLDEALEVALAAGHERLTAGIVNDVLLVIMHGKPEGFESVHHLLVMARTLLERGGGSDLMLGHLALNEGILLRQLGRLDDALRSDRAAQAHFLRAGREGGVAKARLNELVSRLQQGHLEVVEQELPKAVQALTELYGPAAPVTIQAQQILLAGLSYAGRFDDASTVADAMFQSVRKVHTPRSWSYRQTGMSLLFALHNIGETERAHALVGSLRSSAELPPTDALDLDAMELMLFEVEQRRAEILQRIPELRARAEALDIARTTLAIEGLAARNLFLQGRHEDALQVLRGPAARRAFEDPGARPGLVTDLVVVGALLGAPPPQDRTWSSVLDERSPMVIIRIVANVVRAIETEPDPTATVRSSRDRLAEITHERDVTVQLLDAWLAARSSASP